MKSMFGIFLCGASLFAADYGNGSITDYQPGEFAVKGAVKKQLNDQVVIPLSAVAKSKSGAEITIFVTGYAERSRVSGQSDRLAKSRAEEVAAVLTQKFPNAKITSVSNGDENDVGMVTIRWIVAAPEGKTAQTSLSALPIALGALALLIAICAMIGTGTNGPEVKIVERQPTVTNNNLYMMPTPATKAKTGFTLIEYKHDDGKIYSFTAPHVNGKLETPFRVNDGSGKFIIRNDERGAQKSLGSYLRNPKDRQMIDNLIADGTIQVREIARRRRV